MAELVPQVVCFVAVMVIFAILLQIPNMVKKIRVHLCSHPEWSGWVYVSGRERRVCDHCGKEEFRPYTPPRDYQHTKLEKPPDSDYDNSGESGDHPAYWTWS